MSESKSERIIYCAKDPLANLSVELFSACRYHVQENIKWQNGVDFHQILIVLEGKGRVIYNGKEYALRKGTAFYTSPYTPLEYIDDGELVSAFVTAMGDGVLSLARSYGVNGFLYTDSISAERYKREVERIINSYHGGEKNGRLSAMTYAFYADFFENVERCLTVAEEVAFYIDRNFDKRLNLRLLADVSLSSVSGLCHTFKKRYGSTVIEYLLKTRLTYAKKLICDEPALSIKEVAVLSGFEDASYFSRAYKKFYGVTPNEERSHE